MNASEEILIPCTGEDARTPNIVSNIASSIEGSVAGEYMGEDARSSIIEGSVPRKSGGSWPRSRPMALPRAHHRVAETLSTDLD